MTIIFSGNEYKYQLESVMKLFIQAELFDLIFTERTVEMSEINGDYAFIRKSEFKTYTLLYVCCKYNGKKVYKAEIISRIADKYDSKCQLILCKLLYLAMSELTGITSKWGLLTGVRPVKRINKFLSEGKSENEIFDIMRKNFLVDDSKTSIAYMTALTQENIVKSLDEKSFSLYVSIPFCPTRCSYCSFVSQAVDGCKNIIPEYIDNLCKEIAYTAKLSKRFGLKLDTVYFGGGTPSTLEAEQLVKIMDTISENFDMSSVREYTVEAGRADTITYEKLKAIKEHGCKRISVNPQTLNNSVLEAIGRKHTAEQFKDSFKLAKSIGFDSINTDIIAGLPTDTFESFKDTVDELIEMSPENITVHTLSIKRAARLNRSDKKEEILKNPANMMVEYASKRLLECGYKPYYLYRQKNMLENLENIGWCKEGKESLYNIYIMEEIQTIFAVGAGASTKLVDLKNHKLDRIFNYKHPLEYNKHFDFMLEKKKECEKFYAEKE